MKELQILREISAGQPFLQWMGIEVLDAGPGWVREQLVIRPEFFQPSVVHGGVVYALADTVTAHALLTMIYPQEWATTIEQKINYFRPATRGAIIAEGRLVHLGSRIACSESELKNDEGKLIARSTATLMRIPPS